MSLRHTISSLKRNRLMPLLVIVQVAIACAILCNAFFLLYQRLQPMLMPDGIAPGQVIEVDQIVANGRSWNRSEIDAATHALMQIPGVRHVAPAMGIPLSSSMRLINQLYSPSGMKIAADEYVGHGMVDAMGLKLVAGRDFLPDEYVDFGMDSASSKLRQTPIIIPLALARKLFGDGNAVGRILANPHSNGKPGDSYRIVGVVRHLMRYQLDSVSDGRAEDAALLPGRIVSTPILSFVIRTDPQQRAGVLKAIPAVLKAQLGSSLMPGVTIDAKSYEALREHVFSSWRAAVWLLASVCVVVVVVTAIGIMGLTGYWVQQRTRHVGIRRALGARRVDILRYFLLENLLIVGIGIVLGMGLAYGINLFLMRHYELQRMPCIWLPIGAIALWILGQLAVLGPARRAAAVPPVVATRSV